MIEATPRRIVVGVDGSTNSVRALRWAAAEAALRDDEVVALHVWTPTVRSLAALGAVPVNYSFDDEERAAAAVVEEVIRAAFPNDAPVPVSRRLLSGEPASVLASAAGGADLLVVGARGHTGLAGLLIGSTAASVVRHAPCPVVVVPASAQDRSGQPARTTPRNSAASAENPVSAPQMASAAVDFDTE